MAESAVNFLLDKLSAFIVAEASLLTGVGQKVENIKLELENMQALLRDADRRNNRSEELKIWVKQVRETSYDIEVILDEFVYRMHVQRSRGLRSIVLRTFRLPKNLYYKHKFATRLQEVNENVCKISARRTQFNLSQLEEGKSLQYDSESWQRNIETAKIKEEDDVVGMKKEFDLIIKWLLEGDERLRVISITGMGGLGKTTLVSKAFKNSEVKMAFHCFASVSVSQTPRITELLRSLGKQLLASHKEATSDFLASKDAQDLRQLIRNHLQAKRYFIVLDDVWSTKDWEDLRSVFPDDQCRSRLIVTTRDVEVARGMGSGKYMCALRTLNEEEAWELFKKKAFRDEPCPSHLESLARRMVEKCEGLPLAIIAMGGVLLTKEKNMVEWNNVYNSLNWQLSNNPMFQSLYNILLLSFYHLPYYLKRCFLYCSIFPEDYPVKRKDTIRLWVAEGFAKERVGMTMEEVAEEYLKELIRLNILQVHEVNEFGRVRTCRMHDTMREVAISLSRDEDFSLACDAQEGAGQLCKFRCISIYDDSREILRSTGSSSSRPHSVIVFIRKTSPFFDSLQKMAVNFRLLRVLDVSGALIDKVPNELVELFNLRYLNLGSTGISELPKYFEKLRNLQTLDLRDTKLERLPKGISELQKLRHLYCHRHVDLDYTSFHYEEYLKFPPQLCNITTLQSLCGIDAGGETVRQIGNLTQLRFFCIAKVRAADGVELCASIRKMEHLVNLSISAISEEETIELEELSPSPPPLLQKLALTGRLKKVPQWLPSLANLGCLWLQWSKLREEEGEGLLFSLQALPNLAYLYLWKAYDGQQLVFREGWFPRLKKLWLRYLTRLGQLVIENGALSSLQDVLLEHCEELKVLPEGVEHLTTLQELQLTEMPDELVDGLRDRDGNEEDRQKVANIPIIGHSWKSENGQWEYERLN